MNMRNSLPIGLLATILIYGVASAQTNGPAHNDPAATLQRYLDAVNSANYAALVEVLSDDMAPFTYRTCTLQMKPKECLATFVNDTIIKRNGSLVSPSAKVDGDVITALIEVRHDGTRAAGVPRMVGTDIITVKNNKIMSFKFTQVADDASNNKLKAYYAAQTPAATTRP